MMEEEIEKANQQARLLFDQGRIDEAIALAESVTEKARRVLGNTHPLYARCLNNRAALEIEQGRYPLAVSLLKQVIEINRRSLPPGHQDIATSINNLACVYMNLGSYQEAEPLINEALALNLQQLPKDHPVIAKRYNNLGTLYLYQGRFNEAESLCSQAVDIYRDIGDRSQEYSSSLANLGMAYLGQGRYREAEVVYRQVIELDRQILGNSHPGFASDLNNLATLLQAQGRYSESETCFTEALQICQRGLRPGHPATAHYLNNLALLKYARGQYREVESLYRQALEIVRQNLPQGHPYIARSLANLAKLYMSLGRYQEAEALYYEALKANEPQSASRNLESASIVSNLGVLYLSQGRNDEAALTCKRALDIFQDVMGNHNPLLATNISNLATSYARLGRFSEAESLYKQAGNMLNAIVGKHHPDYATYLNNLAGLYRSRRLYEPSANLYKQAFEIDRATLGEFHPDHTVNLFNLASLYSFLSRSHEALEYFDLGIKAQNKMLLQVFAAASEHQRFQFLQTQFKGTREFLQMVSRQLPEDATAVKLAADTILSQKALITEASHTIRDAIMGGKYHHLKDQLTVLAECVQQNAGLAQTLSRKDLLPEQRAELRRMLEEGTRQRQELESSLARQVPEIELRLRMAKADCHSVAASLPPGSALVEFVRVNAVDSNELVDQPAIYLAFILSAGRPEGVRLVNLHDADEIERLVISFLDLLKHDGTTEEELREAGSNLSTRLWEPLLEAVAGCHQVFLAPDGALLELPFGMLPVADGKWLRDTVRIRYLMVGRDVLRLAQKATDASPGPAIILADPDFDLDYTQERMDTKAARNEERNAFNLRLSSDLPTDSHEDYQRMPGTKLQAQLLGYLLPEPQILQGRDAVKSALLNRDRATAPWILHLATHGEFKANDAPTIGQDAIRIMSVEEDMATIGMKNPLLRSWLALAGANTFRRTGKYSRAVGDGLLTAEEVTSMNLQGTEVVTLSACETGLGEIHASEGVMGLRRAFLQAGARTVVVSLWQVDDVATAILMARFYQNLLGRPGSTQIPMNRDLALQEAQGYVRNLSAENLGKLWLMETQIAALCGDDAKRARYLRALAKGNIRGAFPFRHPHYWAGFLCIGETEPLA